MLQRHRPELSESVAADPLGSDRRMPRTFSSGRTCAEPECTTLLSIYNGAKHCAAHNPKQIRVTRSRLKEDAAGDVSPVVEEIEAAPTNEGERPVVRPLVTPHVEDIRRQAS